MSGSAPAGEGVHLGFEYQAPLLTVRLQGVVPPQATLEVTRTYWMQMAEEVAARRAGQLLVLDMLPGEVMDDEDLVRFFDNIAGLGLQAVQIAYVEGRADQVSRIEHAEQLALERGYRVRVFGNESDARLWLRYGGG
jgi:hypothetical protein